MIWLTSDTHFFHNKDFLYKPRGFDNIKDMNEAIVRNWNEYVRDEDTVYHLGDFALGDWDPEIINQLNGHITLIRGNHDTDRKIEVIREKAKDYKKDFTILDSYATVIKHGKIHIYLSHYPTITSNFDEKYFNQHVINFHGHTHQKRNWMDISNPFMYHVGLDSHDNHPVSIEEAINDVRNHWTEINIIKRGI